MNKLNMQSENIVDNNIKYIREKFPNVVVESENGYALDFNALKQELSDVIVDETKEKYQLTWPGKKEAIVTANTPTTNTLRPVREKSVNFDTTENIYIEGDNLEALKILQESYLGKIKCIYIDPPYNTGNDFIYNDNFNKDSNQELLDSGQIDEDGNRLIANSQSAGRFHSNWLSMMYPRLKLARNLLSKDGVILISIDDNELYNLKKICDEIFGENNFINSIAVKMSTASGVKLSHRNKKILKTKEYLLVYCKNKDYISINPQYTIKDSWDEYYEWYVDKKGDNPKNWKVCKLDDELQRRKIFNKNLNNPAFRKFYFENADKIWQRGRNSNIPKEVLEKSNNNWEEIFEYSGEDGTKQYCYKGRRMAFLSNVLQRCINKDGKIIEDIGTLICDFWNNISTAALFSEGGVEFPNGKKPQLLLNIILRMFINSSDIVLDFFSGSGSTAEAVMRLNAYDNLNNKYILVQIPEKIDSELETVCNLGEERIKKSAKKIKEETNADIDYGFRVYKVSSSNMKDVYYKPSELNQEQLNLFETNIKEDRTPEDLLTQVILDLGLTLDLKIEKTNILGNKVYFVDSNSLIACFDDDININIVDEICKYKPLKVVFKDNSFKNDNDKINLEEKIKKISPETEVNIL